MRRVWTVVLTVLMLVGVMALPAYAPVEKFTFEDVTLPDGQVGEIEANSKTHKNKADSYYCGYFADEYQESFGYYFSPVDSASHDPADVLAFCLDHYDDRFEG